jgi:thiol-disulfide isomerase/thioredoxin
MSLRTALVTFALLAPAVAAAQTPAPAPAPAKPKVLAIGDPAPALSIAKWVKGEPVAGFQKGKPYVVEFWATWCRPCVDGFPHLSKLQKQHAEKGLTIVGVTAEDPSNSLEAVEAMVKGKGDVMAYTVAWDDGRKTWDAYMRAARQQGIPAAFIVDGAGRIAYIGHPMGMDAMLEKVVAGKHDIEALAAEARRTRELQEKAGPIQDKLNRAAAEQDWETALKACDEFLALDATEFAGAAAAKYQILALHIKDLTRANAWAREALEKTCKDSAEALHAIAWTIASPQSEVTERDGALAADLAARAVELTQAKDGDMLEILARAWFLKGDPAKALEYQRKAVALDKRYEAAIREYEEALQKRG